MNKRIKGYENWKGLLFKHLISRTIWTIYLQICNWVLLSSLSAVGLAVGCWPLTCISSARAVGAHWALKVYPGPPVRWCQHSHGKALAEAKQLLWCLWVRGKLQLCWAKCKSRCHEEQSIVRWKSRSDSYVAVFTHEAEKAPVADS